MINLSPRTLWQQIYQVVWMETGGLSLQVCVSYVLVQFAILSHVYKRGILKTCIQLLSAAAQTYGSEIKPFRRV